MVFGGDVLESIDVTARLDLDSDPGSQNVSDAQFSPDTPFTLSLYITGVADLVAFSVRISFDSTQVSLVQTSEGSPDEPNVLQTRGGTNLYLLLTEEDGGVKHGGSLLSPDQSTASDAGGLITVWHFRTREDFSAATEIHVDEVVLRTLEGQHTLQTSLTALVRPSRPGFSPVHMDLDSAPHNQGQQRWEMARPGDRLTVEFFLDTDSHPSGFGLVVAYDPAAIEFSLSDFVVDADAGPDFVSLARPRGARTIELGAASLGGTPVAGARLGQVSFMMTDGFSEDTEVILREVVLNFPSAPTQTISTNEVLKVVAAREGVGDFDGDGEVSFADFFLFADAFGKTDPDLSFDLDADGDIDFEDFFQFADAFVQAGGSSAKLQAAARERIGLSAGNLLQTPFPNPFNTSTTISYYLGQASRIALDVFDVSGQKVASLAEGTSAAGLYELTWDATSAGGSRVASGLYVIRLATNNSTHMQKILLVE